jgi:hypothetical protein
MATSAPCPSPVPMAPYCRDHQPLTCLQGSLPPGSSASHLPPGPPASHLSPWSSAPRTTYLSPAPMVLCPQDHLSLTCPQGWLPAASSSRPHLLFHIVQRGPGSSSSGAGYHWTESPSQKPGLPETGSMMVLVFGRTSLPSLQEQLTSHAYPCSSTLHSGSPSHKHIYHIP